MKKNALFIFIIVTQIGLFSCQEIYDDPSIKTDKDILVVQGLITDAAGPYIVNLSKNFSFNDAEVSLNSGETAVTGAEVIIQDDTGNFELLSEKKPGYYVTQANGIKGKPGRAYTLFIHTAEGNIYQSGPCLLKPAPEITSLYAEQTQKLVITTDEYGATHLENTSGIGVFADLTTPSVVDAFCKFDIRIVDETRTELWLVKNFCWQTYYIKDKGNLKSLANYSSNKIIKHQLCFLEKKKYPPEALVLGAPEYFYDGRIVSLYAYSISEIIYNFYLNFYQQLSAENKIFDPVPVNLTGNIKCITDTSKLVLGIFEASGRSSHHYLVRFNSGDAFAKYKDLDYFPDSIPRPACLENEPPYFWQKIF